KIAETYALAAPYLDPPARRVDIPLDGVRLAGYLRMPTDQSATAPAVILVNGTAMVKEESRAMEQLFLARGGATVSVDNPGAGGAWEPIGYFAERERVAEAEWKFLAAIPTVAANRVALFGISLGGAAVLRRASYVPRIRAVAAVCPPYDGAAYYHQVPYLVRE